MFLHNITLKGFSLVWELSAGQLVKIIKYGPEAPVHQERIWINPALIKKRLTRKIRLQLFGKNKLLSGKVIKGDWDQSGILLENTFAFRSCYKHFASGEPWSRTGVYRIKLNQISERGKVDDCQNLSDIIKRYQRLDMIYSFVKQEKRMRTQEELSGKKRLFAKGRGEIEVYIDRHGNPIHGCGGNNRLAIAKVLNLPIIPVKIGVVHPEGIKHLKKYRLTKEELKKFNY